MSVVAALPAEIGPVQRLSRQMLGGDIHIIEELWLNQQHRSGIKPGVGATHFRNGATGIGIAQGPMDGDDCAGDRRLSQSCDT